MNVHDGETGAVGLRQPDGVEVRLVRVAGEVGRVQDSGNADHGIVSREFGRHGTRPPLLSYQSGPLKSQVRKFQVRMSQVMMSQVRKSKTKSCDTELLRLVPYHSLTRDGFRNRFLDRRSLT